ncbi:hypothetical protein E1A91_D11G186300v1 [Gossypium mustelinum]|uniref:Uncharacterized protein n=1 Tax=Gossypium mustelinum TaxID=34275 RepID=A0A5D2STJ9_GOSMU|nr:hypothetical protein E1A91_D11G186300v1 [Gossypium mustelinum]
MMDVERSSLCNFVVNFLLEENYLLTAFELLHELLDDGRDAQAMRLKEFFADPSHFPVDQISRYSSLGGVKVTVLNAGSGAALGKGRKAIRRKLGNVTLGEC